MTETLTAAWDPHLHPRGRDGRFIEIGSIISWFLGADEHQGQVLRIDPETSQLHVRDSSSRELFSVRPQDATVVSDPPKAYIPQDGIQYSKGFDDGVADAREGYEATTEWSSVDHPDYIRGYQEGQDSYDEGYETDAHLPEIPPVEDTPRAIRTGSDGEDIVVDPEAPRAIKAVYLGELEDRVAKLNKRAEKLGVEPMTLEVGERSVVTEQRYIGEDPSIPGKHLFKEVKVEYVTVAVKGQTPHLPGGWQFLGAIEHRGPAGNLVHGDDERLAGFRDSEPNCEHCGLSRARKNTVILEDENGKLVQVGKSCVKDFLGYHSRPDAWLDWADEAGDLYSFEEGGDYVPSRPTAGTDYALATIAATVRRHGFTPKSSFNSIPTAQIVKQILDPKPWRKSDEGTPFKAMVEAVEVNDEDRATADDVRTWASDIDPQTDNNYLGNLRVVLSEDTLDLNKDLGIAASAISARERDREKAASYRWFKDGNDWRVRGPKGALPGDTISISKSDGTRSDAIVDEEVTPGVYAVHKPEDDLVSPGEWGEIGKRGVIVAKVLSKKYIESDYGGSYLVKMVTPEGHTLVTFSSGAFGDDAEVGKVFLGKATPKGYGEWNGKPETQLSRVAASDWDVPFETPEPPKPKAKRAKKTATIDTAALLLDKIRRSGTGYRVKGDATVEQLVHEGKVTIGATYPDGDVLAVPVFESS